MTSRPPPLRAVLVALSVGLAALALLAASYWKWHCDTERFYHQYDIDRLRALRDRGGTDGPHVLRVVALGSSLLRAATFFDSAMDDFSRELGIPIRYVRMAKPGGGLRARHLMLHDVRTARPDLLLIEPISLFFKKDPVIHHRRRLTLHPSRILHRPRNSLWGRRRRNVLGMIRWYEGRVRPRNRQKTSRHWATDDGRLQPNAPGFRLSPQCRRELAFLKKDGVVVVIADIPIHASQEAETDPGCNRDLAAALTATRDEGLVRLMSCPVRFNHSDYDDDHHMVHAARKRYCRWLLGELAGMMMK